jgi:hypothetical protein
MSARVYRDVIFERSGVTILARIRGREFNLIRQADINIISLSVYNATDNQTVPTLAQTIPLSAILDSPLDINSNPRWTQGGVYNFVFTVPATAFPVGARLYQVEFVFTPNTGENFDMVFQLDCIDLFSV